MDFDASGADLDFIFDSEVDADAKNAGGSVVSTEELLLSSALENEVKEACWVGWNACVVWNRIFFQLNDATKMPFYRFES